MKARLLAALVASSLASTAMAAVSGPASTVFENDAHLKAQLSNTSPNKIIIDGELITHVSGPDGAFLQDNTDEGALLITPQTGQPFTVFLETASGIGASIDITPKPGTGKTLRLVPASAPKKDNPDAKAWEESQPWEKTLVMIARTVVNGGTPENYTVAPADRGPAYNPALGITLTPERQLVGSHLRVMRYPPRSRRGIWPEQAYAHLPYREVFHLARLYARKHPRIAAQVPPVGDGQRACRVDAGEIPASPVKNGASGDQHRAPAFFKEPAAPDKALGRQP